MSLIISGLNIQVVEDVDCGHFSSGSILSSACGFYKDCFVVNAAVCWMCCQCLTFMTTPQLSF